MKTIAFVFFPVLATGDLEEGARQYSSVFSASAGLSPSAEGTKPEQEPDAYQFWTWFIDNPCPHERQ
jgi:hypothetical protein